MSTPDRRILSLLLIIPIFAALTTGCARTGQDDVEETAPAGDTTGTATAQPADKPSVVDSPDMAAFPMPAHPPGFETVVGEVELLPEIRKPATWGVCPTSVERDGGTTLVTIESMILNCCTKEVRPSVVIDGDTVEIRIYEYLVDACECQVSRAIRFRLEGAPLDGRALRLFSNDQAEPRATEAPAH